MNNILLIVHYIEYFLYNFDVTLDLEKILYIVIEDNMIKENSKGTLNLHSPPIMIIVKI